MTSVTNILKNKINFLWNQRWNNISAVGDKGYRVTLGTFTSVLSACRGSNMEMTIWKLPMGNLGGWKQLQKCMSMLPELGRQRQEDTGNFLVRPSSQSVSHRLTKRPCLKTSGRNRSKNIPDINLWSPQVCIHMHRHTEACPPTSITHTRYTYVLIFCIYH